MSALQSIWNVMVIFHERIILCMIHTLSSAVAMNLELYFRV